MNDNNIIKPQLQKANFLVSLKIKQPVTVKSKVKEKEDEQKKKNLKEYFFKIPFLRVRTSLMNLQRLINSTLSLKHKRLYDI